MSKELLRVTLSAKQVREACALYVSERTKIGDTPISVDVAYEGDSIDVVIREKRVRKPRAAA